VGVNLGKGDEGGWFKKKRANEERERERVCLFIEISNYYIMLGYSRGMKWGDEKTTKFNSLFFIVVF